MVNFDALHSAFTEFQSNKPFPHCVIDNFLDNDVAVEVSSEFAEFDSNVYNGSYNNAIELKRTCNIWDRFGPATYKVLSYLNSPEFVTKLSILTKCNELYADPGLHGGGQHIHPHGGRLNLHLDYSIHPKLNLQRKFNLLIYLTPEWNSSWGGELGLWNSTNGDPTTVAKMIAPMFNRAVIFDTTQNSWHGIAGSITTPDNIYRQSLAVYYLTSVASAISDRKRALFAPTEEQKDDHAVLELIERRSQPGVGKVEEWIRE